MSKKTWYGLEDKIMARRDGTGPLGRGSMTGRGLGNCVVNVSGEKTDLTKIGFGCGCGMRNRAGQQARRNKGFGMNSQGNCRRGNRSFINE